MHIPVYQCKHCKEYFDSLVLLAEHRKQCQKKEKV